MSTITQHTTPGVRDLDLVHVKGRIYAFVEVSKSGEVTPVVRIFQVVELFYRDASGEDRNLESVMLSLHKESELGRIGADVVELKINRDDDGVVEDLDVERLTGSAQIINGYTLTRFVELGA